jgi:hypothetical protein
LRCIHLPAQDPCHPRCLFRCYSLHIAFTPLVGFPSILRHRPRQLGHSPRTTPLPPCIHFYNHAAPSPSCSLLPFYPHANVARVFLIPITYCLSRLVRTTFQRTIDTPQISLVHSHGRFLCVLRQSLEQCYIFLSPSRHGRLTIRGEGEEPGRLP